jgi:hypothetical protein
LRFKEFDKLPTISVEAIEVQGHVRLLVEGKWIDGRYKQNIRIDRDAHFSEVGADNVHAHVYGRHDRNNALVAVRQSGKSSHGLTGVLHKKDAEALRAQGINVPQSGVIEWVPLPSDSNLILFEKAL